MPIVMFDYENVLVMFDSTFIADQHEGWFDLRLWARVKVDRNSPQNYTYDHRGDSYLAKFKDATFPTFVVKDL